MLVPRHGLLIAFSLLLMAGCGSSKPPAYPVKGKVSGGTSSLAGVMLRFSPVDSDKGTFSSGVIKDDGSYELTTTDGRSGACAGKYKIVLAFGPAQMQAAMQNMSKKPQKPAGGGGGSMPMMGPGMKMPSGGFSSGAKSSGPKFDLPFPESYSKAESSPKEVDVKSGSNVIDIQL